MKIKSILIALLGSATLSHAATVSGTSYDFSAGAAIGGGVLLNGTPAVKSDGITASTGFFNAGTDVGALFGASDFAGIFAAFNVIGSAVVGDTAGSFGTDHAGLYDTGAAVLDAAGGDPAVGQNLWTAYTFGAWSADPAMVLVDSGTQVIADGFPPESYTLFPGTGTLYGNGELTTGTFSAPEIGVNGATAGAVNLVPEPSVALLGALGVLGLIRRRR